MSDMTFLKSNKPVFFLYISNESMCFPRHVKPQKAAGFHSNLNLLSLLDGSGKTRDFKLIIHI